MSDLFSRRHEWLTYQQFCKALKRIIGRRVFYALQSAPQTLRTFLRSVHAFIRKGLHVTDKRSILIIDQGIPRFDHNSGDRRVSELMTLLRHMGYKITFLPFDGVERPDYETHLKQQQIRIAKTDTETHLQKKGGTYGTVIICRVTIGQHCLEQVKKYAPQAAVVFDTVDIHHLRLERRAKMLETAASEQEAVHYKEMEYRLMRGTDCTLVVSEPERAYVQSILPDVKVYVISNIMNVRQKPVWSDKRQRLLFVGNFYHQPNSDGLLWFMKDIFPLIRLHLPSVELDVVGDYDPKDAETLQKDGAILHGHQPCIEPFFDSARLCIAPLRFGAGVKGKLHMSMSEGVPFVTTTIGAEGMFLTNGKDAVIADTAEDFAEGVRKIWTDPALWKQMADAAQDTLMAHFSTAVAGKELQHMFQWLELHGKRSATIRS